MKTKLLLICALLAIQSCAGMPLTLSVEDEHGTCSYSSKRGLQVEIKSRK